MSFEPIHFHRLAAREFRKARLWYYKKSATAAKKFVLAVDRALQRIIDHPERLPKMEKGFQYVRVNRFPYKIIFEKQPTAEYDYIIFAVYHTSRRPGYWRKRPGIE